MEDSEIDRELENAVSEVDEECSSSDENSDYRPDEDNNCSDSDYEEDEDERSLNLPLPRLQILNNQVNEVDLYLPFEPNLNNEEGPEVYEVQNIEVVAVENLPFANDLDPADGIMMELEENDNDERDYNLKDDLNVQFVVE
ncbi:hypothetical protein J6590_000001 [Homalodisca vitripennis]|nr:hypothetical protein J6590_000001 [Homalodisca vitripennis]